MPDPPSPAHQDPERLDGAVERVTFHSEQTGFCVLRVKARGRRDLVPVVGTAARVSPGEYVECEGEWVNDRTHGLQFRARRLRVIPPSNLEGIEKYLASGMVRGIGPHFARKLVEAFGERVFEVIERDPEQLTRLEGIGPKRKARVVSAWAEQKVVREIMVFLQSHGVGTARALRIYRCYGEEAVERVRENPYRLALDIHGIGFRSADTIARHLGIPGDSLIRAEAGVRHVLQALSDEGHCAATREALVESAVSLLDIPRATIETAIEGECRRGHLVAEAIGDAPCLFLAPLRQAEQGIASQLARLAAYAPAWDTIDVERAIPWVEARTGLTLSASQREAVATVVSSKLAVITGGPGVGKTTVLNSILTILRAKDVCVLLCAPTGRAAKRLTESTGIEARTVHRLLEFDPREGGFRRGAGNPLETDLLVVDEASMLDAVLSNQLLRAVPRHAGLLVVGDVDQLPSVGPGNVLADLIDSGCVPTVRLTEIFRQAATSRIIVNAHRINRGLMPLADAEGPPGDFYFIPADTPEAIHRRLIAVVTRRIPRRFGLDPVADIQVLSPMNRGGLGARALNAELQTALNAEATPRITRYGSSYAPGDKVIQTVNDYDKEVFNGDIGRVRHIDPEEGSVIVDFDGRAVAYDTGELDELSLAYAVTVHKSQGSEYPAVVIPLATQHYTLLERNLLYTAVTRGRRLVVIVGQPKALGMAVRSARAQRRLTNLVARLRSALPARGA